MEANILTPFQPVFSKRNACDEAGAHRYFVAETVGIDNKEQGQVSILLCCTSCGTPLMHTFLIPSPSSKQNQ